MATQDNLTAELQAARQKRYELDQKRRAAEAAERQRIEAEQKHQREIAQAEAEIARIEAEQRRLEVEQAQRDITGMVERNRQAVAQAHTALDTVLDNLLGGLSGLMADVESTKEQHSNAVATILQYWYSEADTVYQKAYEKAIQSHGIEARASYEATTASSAHANSKAAQLPPAAAVIDVLALWLQGITDEKKRRVAQAIVFIYTGEILNVNNYQIPHIKAFSRR